jgi:hypothetical protein
MIRNLKALGLALVATFALSALAASGASAQVGMLTAAVPVTLTGVQTAEGEPGNGLTAFGSSVKCAGSTYTGHKETVTPHEAIPSGSTGFTFTPKYVNCVMTPGNFPATVSLNGCDYVVHIGETTAVAGTYGATFDVVCPGANMFEVKIFTTAAKHTENKAFCILRVPSQNGLKGLHITDTGNGTLDLTGTVEGIKIIKLNNGEDALLCSNGEEEGGKRDLDVTLTGDNASGEFIKVSLSHK